VADNLTVTTGVRFTHEDRQTTSSTGIKDNGSAPELNPAVVNNVDLGGFFSVANGAFDPLHPNSTAQLQTADLVALNGDIWRFVDTAGLRRRVRQASGMEYYASLRTASAIEAAEVAIVVLDAGEPLSEQDQRVVAGVVDAGRALVIAFNKWDLVDDDRRYQLDREVDRELGRVRWAPRVNVSARTGRGIDKLAPALRTSLASWDRRISTGRLNTWLMAVVAATPPPARGGRAPRVLFATQADTRPPRFVVFATGFLEAGYRRFLERRLREDFDFVGTPIQVVVRVRERRGSKNRPGRRRELR